MKEPAAYKGVYKEIAEILNDDEAVYRFYEHFHGMQLNCPSKLYNSEYVMACLATEYNGSNAAELARKYNFTYSWIMKLLKKAKAVQPEPT